METLECFYDIVITNDGNVEKLNHPRKSVTQVRLLPTVMDMNQLDTLDFALVQGQDEPTDDKINRFLNNLTKKEYEHVRSLLGPYFSNFRKRYNKVCKILGGDFRVFYWSFYRLKHWIPDPFDLDYQLDLIYCMGVDDNDAVLSKNPKLKELFNRELDIGINDVFNVRNYYETGDPFYLNVIGEDYEKYLNKYFSGMFHKNANGLMILENDNKLYSMSWHKNILIGFNTLCQKKEQPADVDGNIEVIHMDYNDVISMRSTENSVVITTFDIFPRDKDTFTLCDQMDLRVVNKKLKSVSSLKITFKDKYAGALFEGLVHPLFTTCPRPKILWNLLKKDFPNLQEISVIISQ